jgi:hypothetical protein
MGAGDGPRAAVCRQARPHRSRTLLTHVLLALIVVLVVGPAEPVAGWMDRFTGPCRGPLLQAHAHNDQEREHPLVDAVRLGFTSVEADVWLDRGTLLVGHTMSSARRAHRTLDQAYLAPLSRSARRQASPVRWLLLDLKTPAAETVRAVSAALDRRPGLAGPEAPAHTAAAPITVVVTGAQRGLAVAVGSDPRLRVDHRLPGGRPADRVGGGTAGDWVSGQWDWHFRWNGTGVMPSAERDRLRQLARTAHRHDRLLRFWGTPTLPGARENVWSELLAAGVGRVSTDDLSALERFLRTQGGCAVRPARRP